MKVALTLLLPMRRPVALPVRCACAHSAVCKKLAHSCGTKVRQRFSTATNFHVRQVQDYRGRCVDNPHLSSFSIVGMTRNKPATIPSTRWLLLASVSGLHTRLDD